MKKIIFILLFVPVICFAQRPKTGNIYYDTTVLTTIDKTGNELVIENDTKDSTGGVLTNVNNGRTQFKKARIFKVNDSNYVFKLGTTVLGDTIKLLSGIVGGGGISQQTLNDTVARLDSTINAIPLPDLQNVTDNGSTTTNTITTMGSLVAIGGVSIGSAVNGGQIRMFDQNNSGNEIVILPPNNLSNSSGNITLPEIVTGRYLPISVNNSFSDINGNIALDLITSDSLAQIRQEISDTATQIRSEIPDVSSYATITNLKDSTALVRGLITSSIPTFSLSKNSTRDSIVTTYNGTRSAVKDSSIVMPTFSFGRNASLDSIYAIYNGTRYSAKDSLPTVSATSTTTFTNKRITARVDSTTSSATPTINTDNVDTYKLTAQAADITSFTTNLSGTPSDDQILHIVIIGTATRAITWGSEFEASTVALPTATVGTNRLDVYFIWNTVTSKWRCGGVW